MLGVALRSPNITEHQTQTSTHEPAEAVSPLDTIITVKELKSSVIYYIARIRLKQFPIFLIFLNTYHYKHSHFTDEEMVVLCTRAIKQIFTTLEHSE